MARPKTNGPTERELEILRVLWKQGPSSVRAVLGSINHGREKKIAYTSLLTIMSVMQTKSLLSRDESHRMHIYSPVSTRTEVEQHLVKRLIDDVFDGSAARLVALALSARVTSAADAARIDELLAAADSHDLPE